MLTDDIHKEKVIYYFEKVSKSTVFSRSPRNIRLFRFLVQNLIDNMPVKESIIMAELFQGNKKEVTNDGKVRVYMYNLRQKLAEYYSSAGAGDDYVFRIEKGCYDLVFEKRTNTEPPVQPKKKLLPTVVAGMAIVLVFILFWYFNSVKNSYCWKPFFAADAQNICFVSDHYAITGYNIGDKTGTMTGFGVRNDADLQDLRNEHHLDKLTKAPYTFVTKMGPISAGCLSAWFARNDKDLTIEIGSDFNWNDLKSYNILFVGQFKTMGNLKSLLLKDSKHFKLINTEFVYSDDSTETIYRSLSTKTVLVDYGMVSYFRIGPKQYGLFFTSNNDIAVIATVKNFTDEKWLRNFYKKLPKGCTCFNALFKVSGMYRTELSCELIRTEPIEP